MKNYDEVLNIRSKNVNLPIEDNWNYVKNVGRDGGLLTLPSYMQFLLNLEPEDLVLEPVDVDAVNAMAKEILNK